MPQEHMKPQKFKKITYKARMMGGEEEMKGFVLKSLGIDPTKKYKEFDFIQQGHADNNPEIKKILERCGGKPKKCNLDCFEGDHHKETGYGRPEYIIKLKGKKSVLIVELKPQQHQSEKLNQPKIYNLDGVLYYAKYFKKNYDVLFLTITGLEKDKKKRKISFGIWRNQKEIYETIYLENEVLPLNKYFSRLENTPTVEAVKKTREVAKDLHDRLRALSITEEDKPLFISFCLIALKDMPFSSYLAKKDFPSEERLLQDLRDIPKKVMKEEYQEKLITKISGVLDNKELAKEHKNRKIRLSSILEELRQEVVPLMRGSSIDVVGVFYHEFLTYSKGDGGGLGIVLTPSHIAELFTELVNLKPTDKVLDICCGTGTFLVSALNKMRKEATEEEKEQIKKNIYGIESQPKVYHLVLTNMVLHEDGKSNVYNENCFDTETIDPETEEIKEIGKKIKEVNFDIGFLNPPYSLKGGPNEGKFILHLLSLMKTGGKVAVITHVRLARGMTMKNERKELLKSHTLKAVMSMPTNLFYGNQAQPPTCIMVWIANEPHKGKTWLANWMDDGFIVEKGQRIEKYEGKWKEVKERWIKKFNSQEEEKYVSKLENLDTEKNWLPEGYLANDYSQLKEEQFIESIRDYLGYVMKINPIASTSSFSFLETAEELANNLSFSPSFSWKEEEMKDWQEFSIKDLLELDPPQRNDFRTKKASPYFKNKEQTIPLISNAGTNNGCVGFIEKSSLEPTKGDCITISSFGFAFYQPIDFYYTCARGTGFKNVFCGRVDWLNEKRGLFISSLFTNLYKKLFHYGYQVSKEKIYEMKIKLPVIREGEQKGQPDWEFMENYIKQVICSLSLSLSMEIQFLQKLI